MKRFIIVLSLITVTPFLLSLGGNPFGPYLASYVSSALVVAGVFELVSAIVAKSSILRAALIIVAGCVVAILVNMIGALGLNLYVAFILGQILTVSIVRWIFSNAGKMQTAKVAQ
ncbi:MULTISPECIES: hypothetical protein [Glutamicibacter]|uniref:hypothetical protein n=1 Tax=Glutamicibacter TaxID=1742989 RepID=UPI003F8DC833